MLTAKKALAASRVYTEETVIGMGAIKGANCTIKSITKVGDLNTVIFSWTDTEGTEHESTMLVYDGAPGHDGDDGFSPTITVKTATSSEYVLTITDVNGSYDTPNLKGGGGGGGGASSLSDLDDIALSALANGDALIYDSTSGKWKNVQLDIPSELSDLSDVDLTSLANADVLKYDFATQKFVNDKIDYSELTGTPTLGTAAAKDSTNAVTENSTDLVESGAVYTGLAAKANTADLGTAAAKDSTNAVTQSSTDLVESGAVYTALADKVDKEAGKGLSTNDFTDAEKSKLDDLELDDLSDVDMTGITDGQVLAWDDANSKFVPADNTGEEYTAGEGIEISQDNEISSKIVMYTGTKAAWDVLPLADKKKYTHASFTDDSESGVVDSVPTEDSVNLVTSGGVFAALEEKADPATTLAGYGITDAYTKTETGNAITAEIEKLDVSDAAVAGSYVTQVSEADGKISVAREAADVTPTSASKKMLTSGGAYTALADKSDKVTSATNGDFAGLDASGNLTDSGKKASDFATAQALDDEAVTRSAMGAKNLFRVMNASQVINGIEWVVNDDGTITANGTATDESKFTAQSKSAATHYYDENMMKAIAGKTIRYSGCPSGGSSSTYLFRLYIANAGGPTDEYGEGAERTIVSDFLERNFSVECIIKSGQTVTNLTYKPMICLASDTDTTYQHYSKTNKQLTDDTASAVANVPNGAINLAKPVSARTTTVNDVEFVIDSEGKVTANGTASANIRFDMAEVTLKAGRTYKIYEPSSLQARRPLNPEACRCYARIKSSGVWVLQNNGWRENYTPTEDVVVSVGIAMQSGNEVTDEIFAPMLVLDGTDVGDTFYPYAMTNRELTANVWIGKPRSAWLNLGNKTTLTITVPITPYGGSYMQGLIKLFGFNNSTLIDCSFAFTLSKDNDSVNASKLTNYGDSAVTLGSITTDGTNATITLNNLTTYVNLMLFYGTSMHNTYVSNTNMPEWTFS